MKQLLSCFGCLCLAACCTQSEKVQTVSLEKAISSVRAAIESGYAYCDGPSQKCRSNAQLSTVTISLALASTDGQEVDVALPGKYPFSLGGKGTFSETQTNTITLVWVNPCFVDSKRSESTTQTGDKHGNGMSKDHGHQATPQAPSAKNDDPYECDVAGPTTYLQ